MPTLHLQLDNPPVNEAMGFSIYSRRYLGNKTNFIPLIEKVVKENGIQYDSVLEACMGTGVLSYYFATKNKKVMANDLLPLNFVLGKAFLCSYSKLRPRVVKSWLKKLNMLPGYPGALTKLYGDTFVPQKISYQADAALAAIRNARDINAQERYYLAASLIMAMEKVSNIDLDYLGHEKIGAQTNVLNLRPLNYVRSTQTQVFLQPAEEMVKKRKVDLIIVDPTFGQSDYRDYMDYPEHIVELIFPKFLRPARSDFSNPAKAKKALARLIQNTRSNCLMFFYSDNGIVKRETLMDAVVKKYVRLIVYSIIRKPGLHSVRNEPKTDYLIVGINR